MHEGILLVDKPKGKTSFSLVSVLRKILNVRKIGHTGTLDPMATGVMVLLIGKRFTTLSDALLAQDKEYRAEITLGITTDSYDAEGKIVASSDYIPSLVEVETALMAFQGWIEQIPPMFSAKKIQGRKLYEYARQGRSIARPASRVFLKTALISYEYPKIILHMECSKGTYIRSIAYELGVKLSSGAHLSSLTRIRSGTHTLDQCLPGKLLFEGELEQNRTIVVQHLRKDVHGSIPVF
jgi:tRNA pseudouridine55 synthase